MGIDVHTIDQIDGSQFSRQDRVLMGMIQGLATPPSATSVTVLGAVTAGSGFTNLSTVTLAPTGGTGSGLTAVATALKAVSVSSVATPGTGYAINDTITLAGGTLQPGGPGAAAVLTVSKALLASLALNAAGSGYAINDTITLSGGTSTTAAVVTVTGVTAGAIAAFSITTAGVYSAETSTFTQASTSGSGSGATFKTAVWGVQAVTISTAGAYTAVPANAAAQGGTSGSGTGATFNLSYGLASALITSSGNYTAAPSMTVTDSASGTGASIAAATLGGNGNTIYIPVSFNLPASYNVQIEPNFAAIAYVPLQSKTNSGFSIALVPPNTGVAHSAGTIDVAVFA